MNMQHSTRTFSTVTSRPIPTMASTRPLVYIPTYSEPNTGLRVTPELEAYAKQYFNLVSNEELRKDNSMAKKVKNF